MGGWEARVSDFFKLRIQIEKKKKNNYIFWCAGEEKGGGRGLDSVNNFKKKESKSEKKNWGVAGGRGKGG